MHVEPLMPQHSFSSMQQTKWDGEEKKIWWASERNWTRLLLPVSVYHVRGTSIQENCSYDHWKAQQALQQNYALDQMQTELLPPKMLSTALPVCSPLIPWTLPVLRARYQTSSKFLNTGQCELTDLQKFLLICIYSSTCIYFYSWKKKVEPLIAAMADVM